MSSHGAIWSGHERWRRLLILCCACCAALAARAQEAPPPRSATLPPTLQRVVDGHRLPADSYSFYVRAVNAPAAVLSINAGRPMHPASTVKAITTLAALESLGPAFAWHTELYALGPVRDGVLQGDLLMKGGGDPFLVEEKLRAMLKALQRTGVSRITGELVLDGSYFDDAVGRDGSFDNQNGRSYNTDPNAVISNFQSVTFYFTPHPNGRDVVIRPDPSLPNLSITNRLALADRSCGGYQRGISFHVEGEDRSRVIFEGSFPAGCSQYSMVREVLDPPGYTYGLFKNLWEEVGGSLEGGYRLGTAPAATAPLLRWSSAPMADIIKSINKYSNNLMTRHLLLTLGAEVLGPPATVRKGIDAVNNYLEIKGLDSRQLVMDNGAGLSRDTRVSTALLGDVLHSAWASPWMPEYIASLPLNGLDGTMRGRLRAAPMAGRMHIKTGSLDEVAAVAGYVYAGSNTLYAVSGIVNHELADRGPGVELLDALLAWVYRQ